MLRIRRQVLVRILPPIFGVILVLSGCSSRVCAPLRQSELGPVERAIHERLRKESVPLPTTTPYDGIATQRQVYVDGFRGGWDHAISGAILHSGLVSTPLEVPQELGKAWREGWRAGAKQGGDRWMKELGKLCATRRVDGTTLPAQ
jgi:hypothetical protein